VIGVVALWFGGWEVGAVLTALLIVPPCLVIALSADPQGVASRFAAIRRGGASPA
jgi:hypothetical protein